MTPPIYKVFRLGEWQDFAKSGSFSGSPDDRRDGYIHFSTAVQVPLTLERYFAAEAVVVLAQADAAAAGPALKYEAARGGALFPHLYGVLHARAILRSERLVRGAAGFTLPSWVGGAAP
jgi:uncharacterized protein (DUF952 family)